jgi:hypothetical protein
MDYDKEFYSYLNKNGDYKVITNPPTYSGKFMYGNFKGIPTEGGDASLLYGNKPFFVSDGPLGELKDVIDYLEYSMYTDENFLINNYELLKMLGIRYFIVRKNILPEHSKNSIYFNPNIEYKTNNNILLISTGDINRIYELASWNGMISVNGKELDTYYKKINSSIYYFTINAESDLIELNLNNNYSENWKLLFIEWPFFGSNCSNHKVGPLNTNLWVLSTSECTKKISDIEGIKITGYLYYLPQIILYLGLIISIFGLVIIGGYKIE